MCEGGIGRFWHAVFISQFRFWVSDFGARASSRNPERHSRALLPTLEKVVLLLTERDRTRCSAAAPLPSSFGASGDAC